MRTHLKVSVTSFGVPSHGGDRLSTKSGSQGWGKRNRPWGFGRPLYTLNHGLSADKVVLSVLLLAGTLLAARIYGARQIDINAPNRCTPMICWGASSSSVKQDHIIIRQDQTRMRRPNIKTSRWDRMGNRSHLNFWLTEPGKASMAGSALPEGTSAAACSPSPRTLTLEPSQIGPGVCLASFPVLGVERFKGKQRENEELLRGVGIGWDVNLTQKEFVLGCANLLQSCPFSCDPYGLQPSRLLCP